MSLITSTQPKLLPPLELIGRNGGIKEALTRAFDDFRKALIKVEEYDYQLTQLFQQYPTHLADIPAYEEQSIKVLTAHRQVSEKLKEASYRMAEKTDKKHRDKYFKHRYYRVVWFSDREGTIERYGELEKCHQVQLRELHDFVCKVHQTDYATRYADLERDSCKRKDYAQKALTFNELEKELELLHRKLEEPEGGERGKFELKQQLETRIKEQREQIRSLAQLESQVPERLRQGFIGLSYRLEFTDKEGDLAGLGPEPAESKPETMELYRGKLFYYAGDLGFRAMESYQRCALLDPTDPEWKVGQAFFHVSALHWEKAKVLSTVLPEKERSLVRSVISQSQYRAWSSAFEVTNLVLPLFGRMVVKVTSARETDSAFSVLIDFGLQGTKEPLVRDWLISRYVEDPEAIKNLIHLNKNAVVGFGVHLLRDFLLPQIVVSRRIEKRFPALQKRAALGLGLWRAGEQVSYFHALLSTEDPVKTSSAIFSGMHLIDSIGSTCAPLLMRYPGIRSVIDTVKRVEGSSLTFIFKAVQIAVRYSDVMETVGKRAAIRFGEGSWLAKAPSVITARGRNTILAGVGLVAGFHFWRSYPRIWAANTMQQANLLCQQARYTEARRFLQACIKSYSGYLGDRKAVEGYEQSYIAFVQLLPQLRPNQRSKNQLTQALEGVNQTLASLSKVADYSHIFEFLMQTKLLALLKVRDHTQAGTVIQARSSEARILDQFAVCVMSSAIHEDADDAIQCMESLCKFFPLNQRTILDCYRAYRLVQKTEPVDRSKLLNTLDALLSAAKERNFRTLLESFQEERFFILYEGGNAHEANQFIKIVDDPVQKRIRSAFLRKAIALCKEKQFSEALALLRMPETMLTNFLYRPFLTELRAYLESIQTRPARAVEDHLTAIDKLCDQLDDSLKGFREELQLEKLRAYVDAEQYEQVKNFLDERSLAFHRRFALDLLMRMHSSADGAERKRVETLLNAVFLKSFAFKGAIQQYQTYLSQKEERPLMAASDPIEIEGRLTLIDSLAGQFSDDDFEKIRSDLDFSKLCVYFDTRRDSAANSYLPILRPKEHIRAAEYLIMKTEKREGGAGYLKEMIESLPNLQCLDILTSYQAFLDLRSRCRDLSTATSENLSELVTACTSLAQSLEEEPVCQGLYFHALHWKLLGLFYAQKYEETNQLLTKTLPESHSVLAWAVIMKGEKFLEEQRFDELLTFIRSLISALPRLKMLDLLRSYSRFVVCEKTRVELDSKEDAEWTEAIDSVLAHTRLSAALQDRFRYKKFEFLVAQNRYTEAKAILELTDFRFINRVAYEMIYRQEQLRWARREVDGGFIPLVEHLGMKEQRLMASYLQFLAQLQQGRSDNLDEYKAMIQTIDQLEGELSTLQLPPLDGLRATKIELYLDGGLVAERLRNLELALDLFQSASRVMTRDEVEASARWLIPKIQSVQMALRT